MTKRTHQQLKKSALKREGVKNAYDALEEEFSLLEEMIKARLEAGKTQNQVIKPVKQSKPNTKRDGKHLEHA